MGVNTEKQDPANIDVMTNRVTNEKDLAGYLKGIIPGAGGGGDDRITLADNVESFDVENIDGDTTVHITTKDDSGQTKEMTLYGDGDFNLAGIPTIEEYDASQYSDDFADVQGIILKIGKLCIFSGAATFRALANTTLMTVPFSSQKFNTPAISNVPFAYNAMYVSANSSYNLRIGFFNQNIIEGYYTGQSDTRRNFVFAWIAEE